MAAKRTITFSNDGMATLAKEAVSAGREWGVAMREAALNPMVKLFTWNPPMTAMMEPWVEMTRQAHDRWLECWEAQNHELIDQMMRLVGTGTERFIGQVKGSDGARASAAS